MFLFIKFKGLPPINKVIRFLLLLLILFTLIYFHLPFFTEQKILPHLFKSLGFDSFSGKVEELTLTKFHIANVNIGGEQNTFLMMPSLKADYSVSGLIKGNLNSILINGFNLNLEYKDNVFITPGQIMSKSLNDKSGSSTGHPICFKVRLLEILDSFINLKFNNDLTIIPIKLELKLLSEIENHAVKYQFNFETFSFLGIFESVISIDSDFKNIAIKLKPKNLNFNLNRISSKFTDLNIKGSLTLDLNIKDNISADCQILLTDMNISIPESKLEIEGLNLKLKFDDLLNLKSAPKQSLSFKTLKFEDFELTHGDIIFQVISTSSYIIEATSFSWCDGFIKTPGFDIIEGNDLSFILNCNKLNLAKILEQLKTGEASGEGEVNGDIPISFNKNEIIIKEGYLFSTPGQTGYIRFKQSAINTTTIEQQSIQTAIAVEALKDFQYDKAKLLFDNVNEELVITLEMSGKPVNPLPFGYDKKRGLYLADKNSDAKAKFQGIQFDINFKVPLNKLMFYKKRLNDLVN